MDDYELEQFRKRQREFIAKHVITKGSAEWEQFKKEIVSEVMEMVREQFQSEVELLSEEEKLKLWRAQSRAIAEKVFDYIT